MVVCNSYNYTAARVSVTLPHCNALLQQHHHHHILAHQNRHTRDVSDNRPAPAASVNLLHAMRPCDCHEGRVGQARRYNEAARP